MFLHAFEVFLNERELPNAYGDAYTVCPETSELNSHKKKHTVW